MPANNPFIVDIISIIVVPDKPAPATLNPDFLKASKIVPKSWKVREEVSIPILSKVVFQNRMVFQWEPHRIVVEDGEETEDEGFKKKYSVHDRTAKFLKAVPYVKPKAIGLNARMIWRKDNAAKWIQTKFLKIGDWSSKAPKLMTSKLNFGFSSGNDWTLNLELSAD